VWKNTRKLKKKKIDRVQKNIFYYEGMIIPSYMSGMKFEEYSKLLTRENRF